VNCAELEARVDVSPLGTLEGADKAAVEVHIASCAACRGRVAALAAAYGQLDESVAADATPLSPGLGARLVAALEREHAAPTASPCAACRTAVPPEERVFVESECASYHVECFAKKQRKPEGKIVKLADPVKVSLNCSFCKGELSRGEASFCAACLAPHHADCFEEHGRCAAPGCGEQRVIQSSMVPVTGPGRGLRRGPGPRLVAAALALAGVGGAAAFAGLALVRLRPVSADRPIDRDAAVTRAPLGDDLTGAWDGGDWGEVLVDGEHAVYSANCRTGQGRMLLHVTGHKTYDGTWGESDRRYGTLSVTVSDDGHTAKGTWKASEGAALGDGASGSLNWKRKEWPDGTGAPAPVIGTRGALVAKKVYIVVDDFVVDVWLNGVRVPDSARKPLDEIFGMLPEVIELDLHERDWIVFNVVNDRFRWGGAKYFGVCALDADGEIAFTTGNDGTWSACDAPGAVPAFIASREVGMDRLATAFQGDATMDERWRNYFKRDDHPKPDFTCVPVWGTERTTWIKHVVGPAKPRARRTASAQKIKKVAWCASVGPHAGAPLVGSGGLVHVQAGNQEVVAFDAATGKTVWGEVEADGDAGSASSAALGPGDVSFAMRHGVARALGPDGKQLWATDVEAGPSFVAPVISPDGKTLYVSGDKLGLASLDARTGNVNWIRREHWNGGRDRPRYGFDLSGRLLGCDGRSLYRFYAENGAYWKKCDLEVADFLAMDEALVVSSGKRVHGLDPEEHGVRWTASLDGVVTGLAPSGREVVVSLDTGELVGLDGSAGTLLWRQQLSKAALGPSTVTRDGEVLVTDARMGVFLCAKAHDGSLRVELPGQPGRLSRPVVGPDGRVYVSGANTLYCLVGE
jgi:outer membrane protein assembly factor BamB